jgi:hypothetical protein
MENSVMSKDECKKDDDYSNVNISVERLKEHCNPFTYFGISVDMVAKAIRENRLSSLNHMERATPDNELLTSVERVTYFVIYGFEDPIQIDVGVPVLNFYPDWMIPDGNHRLMAAIYRKDEFIKCSVSGQNSYTNALFETSFQE